ncbi:MAG: hypothetical protein DMG65_05645 [Candidatus Angelobacter sp. Gp1-AA117]|nr:MAG: hypothetical protein DMG65_05645 [Candidatus Angelobacter sp. Gp1-AA117]
MTKPAVALGKSIQKKRWSKWTLSGIGTAALVVAAIIVFTFYYFGTRPDTIVIVPEPFPGDLKPGFTENQLVQYVRTSLDDISNIAAKTSPEQSSTTNIGLQLISAKPPYTTWRLSSPLFDQKIRGMTANMLRQGALSLRVKRFVYVNAIKVNDKNNFRLFARLEDNLTSSNRYSWKVPEPDQSCQGPEVCAAGLAQEMLEFLDPHALVLYYLKQNNEPAFRKVIALYTSRGIPAEKMGIGDYFAWGDALRGVNENDQAIIQYREGLKWNDQFCSGHDIIGITYLKKYQYESRVEYLDSAEQEFRQAISCNPSDAVAHCDLGNILIRRWKLGGFSNVSLRKDAIAENVEALKIDPNSAEPAVNIGYIQYWDGRTQEALKYFQQIKENFPTSSALHLNFGFLLWREYINGRSDLLQQALDITRRAWDLDSANHIAAGNLGYLYYEADSPDLATEFWKKAYDLDPQSPDILAGYALGLYKKGKQNDAVSLYREAVRRDAQIRDSQHLRNSYLWTSKMLRDVVSLDAAAFAQQ